MGTPGYPRVSLGGAKRRTASRGPHSERLAGAVSERVPQTTSLRPSAPPLLFSARGARPRRGGSAHARAGRGRERGGAGGGLGHRPPPPRPAPSGHCRISIGPRHNFAEAQRDPGARAGGNIVPAGGRLAQAAAAAARARAGLRGAARGCAGLPAPGGHAPGGAVSPGTPRNLPGILRSWGGRGLGAAAPGRLSSPSTDRPPRSCSAVEEGACVPPPARPSPPPPTPAPAEPRNFPAAGAKVSAKCCPSC